MPKSKNSPHYEHKIVNIGDLSLYENNPRTHSEAQITQIKNSIEQFGFTNPILISESNLVIAGHGRLEAARELELEQVPAIVVSGLSKAQHKALVIADNQLALNAGWDYDLLQTEIEELQELDFNIDLLGFDDDFIEDLVNSDLPENNSDPDDCPEMQEKAVSVIGDLWLLGEHRVFCGDSTSATNVEKLLFDKKIDLIFSDPPYGVSYSDKNEFLNKADKGNTNQTPIKNDSMTLEETGQLWADVFSLWSTYLNDYSSYYISSPQGGELYLMMMLKMNENGFPLKHTIIWNKNNHVLGRCDYNYKHEPIIYGWKERHKFYGKGDHTKSVWDINKPHKSELHPTMKPVELVENCILNSTKKGELVCDMFLGSGTTLIASEKTGRICYGTELSENYCDTIIRRWQEYSGKTAVLEETGQTFEDIEKERLG